MTKLSKLLVAEFVSTDEVKFAVELVVETKFTVYPSNRSVIIFDDRVSVIPSTTNVASTPAIFCLDALVVELSNEDKPEPKGFL